MKDGGCHHRTLAHSPECRVDSCNCGVVHLVIGPLTLRLEATAAQSISDTLSEGLRALAQPAPGLPRLTMLDGGLGPD